ncbi:uncharacterized protein rab11fip1a isoform X1 [Megalops cyprinoides]|uniref:uncharacterized protein rab11fip1a isoform X1 n=1 Tax=Megalops cyprinoides TaxID=118141 RepID=UPI001864B331|nr:uncharacterized protein rab11fip1a isoform X1 [Megalops cyprinoides]
MFSELHTSLAPPKPRWSSTESLSSSTENLAAAGSSASSTEKKRQAPLPPSYQNATKRDIPPPTHKPLPAVPAQTDTHSPASRQPKTNPRSLSAKTAAASGYLHPIAEHSSSGNAETSSSQQTKLPALPLPDYDTLYPKRKHGVQGQMRWDHIVAEVTQRQREYPPELSGQEMSVDRPGPGLGDWQGPTDKDRPASSDMKTTGRVKQTEYEKEPPHALKPVGSSSKQAIVPPKSMAVTPGGPTSSVTVKQGQSTRQVASTIEKPNLFASRVFGAATPKVHNSSVPSMKPPQAFVGDERKVLNTSVNVSAGKPLPEKERQRPSEKVTGGIQEKPDNRAKEPPPVAFRQRPVSKESRTVTQMERSATVQKVANEDAQTLNAYMKAVNKGSETVAQVKNSGPVLTEKSANEGKDTSVFVMKAPVNEDSEEARRMTDSTTIMAKDTEMAANEEAQPSVDTFVDAVEAANVPKQDLFVEKAEELFPVEEKSEPDPFPNDPLLSNDPWALPAQDIGGDDLFTGGPKREQKPEELGMTADDIEKIFASQGERDPFSNYYHSDTGKFPEKEKPIEHSLAKQSPVFQRASSKKGRAPLPPVKADNFEVKKSNQASQVQPKKEDTMVIMSAAKEQQLEHEVRNLRSLDEEKAPFQGREGQWEVDPFSSPSSSLPFSLTTSEPLKTAWGDDTPQPGGVSGGKTPLRAWVSPSEAQPITMQTSSGGGAVGKGGEPASTPRRPHPVKPLSSLESQTPTSISSGRDIKSSVIHENVPLRMKVTSSVESGPYSQLTQDELISLVVKQQAELSKKDGKILELEEYIDNLLVRVIEEKPSILLSMASTKKAC